MAKPCRSSILPQLRWKLRQSVIMGKSKHRKRTRPDDAGSCAQPLFAMQPAPMQMPMPMSYPSMMQPMPPMTYGLQPVIVATQTPVAVQHKPRPSCGRVRRAPPIPGSSSDTSAVPSISEGCSSASSSSSTSARQHKSAKKARKAKRRRGAKDADEDSADEAAPIGRNYKTLGGSAKSSYPRVQRSAQ